MELKKHKRKIKRYLIFTSNAADRRDRQLRIRMPVVVLLCLVLIGLIATGVTFVTENEIFRDLMTGKQQQQELVIRDLEDKNESLEKEVQNLTSNVSALSETLQQKMDDETKLQAQVNEYALPTDFPLNRAASVEEEAEENALCVFEASEGSFVIASARGIVTAVENDAEYGHRITVDHGNGYVTIYRNKGDAQVKIGDEVLKGMTLYIIGEENTSLGYQMMLNGEYINPMDMLMVSG